MGDAVSKARPYFDALRKSKKAKQRTQFLANQYTRAQQVWRASRELVKAGEDKMMNGLKTPSDMQWLEMLNEANEKANEVCSIYIDVLYFILKGRNSIKISVLISSETKISVQNFGRSLNWAALVHGCI